MARYRVQTASGRFYDVELSEGEDIESVVAEIERSEAPAPSAGGGRGFINPPMAGQQQPTYPKLRPAPAPDQVDYGQAATDMMGGSVPAPVSRSVMDQPGPVPQTPGFDPMLNQGYVAEVRRDIIGKAAPEDRMGLLTTLAENRTDVLGRAARQILAEVQAENKRINLDQEGRAQRLLDAPRGPGNLPPPRPGAGAAPPPVPVPDVFPGISDVMEGRTAKQIAERRMLAQGVRAADEGMRMDEANRVVNLDRDRTVGEYLGDLGVRLEQGGIMARQVIANTIDPTSQWAAELAQKMKASQEAISAPEQYRAQQFASKLAQQPNEWAKGAVMLAEFVTNPTIAVEEVVRQGPLMGAMIAATVFGGGVGGLAVRGAAAVAPKVALADAISGGMVVSAGRAAGAAATARGAAAVAAGGDAAGQVYEELTSKKNAQLMRENADVKRLMDEGKTFEEARSEVALTKARLAQSIAATGGVIFGAAGFEGLLAKKIAGQAVGGTAKRAAVTEITTELADELTTTGAANFAIGQVDPNRALTQDFGQIAATTLVTTSPTAGASAYLASREQGVDPLTDAYARANLSTTNPSEEFISPTQTARSAMDVGPSAPARNDAGLIGSTINFTPPDSITAQAGLAPIVVPTAPGSVGGTDVGLPNVLGGLAGGSGVAGGSDPLAGLGGAGRDAAVPGAGGVNAAGALAGDGGAALLGAGATQPGPTLSAGRGERATDADLLARAEQAAGLTPAPAPAGAPAKIWAGRAGDGYVQQQDAQQALPGLQRKYPDLSWNLQQDADGKFFWSGTTRGDAGGTAVTGAAGQGLAATTSGSGAQQPGVAGAGMVDLGQAVGDQPGLPGGAATVGGAAANEPAFSLKLAPPAPLRAAGQAITMLKKSRGVDVEISDTAALTEQQKVASAMARLVGKTVTYMDYVAGPADQMPNGFVIPGKEQNIYLDSKSEDGALFVMMHEGVHALPQPIREKLVTTIKGLTKTDMRGDFAQKFGYDINNEAEIDNEIAAFMTQAVSKRQDFWQELRTKMGDGDFVEVAKVIIEKIDTFIQGAKSAYGDEFIQRYATDAVAVRNAVSTAYADAMKAQGQQVPAAATTAAAPGITASNRAADVNPLGMYSELARKLDAGPNQAPVDQWKAYIKGLPQKGVKPDEIEWSGVEDFLELKRAAGQKVTKAEVAEYLQQGGVKVEETVLSDEGTTDLPAGWRVREATEDDDAAYRYVLVDDNNEVRGEGATSAEAMADGWDPDSAAERPTKYSQYTMPGGENYREVLLTLPVSAKNAAGMAQADRIREEAAGLAKQAMAAWTERGDQAEFDRLNNQSRDLYRQAGEVEKAAGTETYKYESKHWDQPNVLAHIRVNDRTDADGKRVLFVEELQSDWGQEGKKQGFQEESGPAEKAYREYEAGLNARFEAMLRNDLGAEIKDPTKLDRLVKAYMDKADAGARAIALQEKPTFNEYSRAWNDELRKNAQKIPAAPFIGKTEGWLNLALKRVMTMAAEGGYDRVAFADAEPHFKRWGTERIDWAKQPDGSFLVRAKSQEGGEAAGMNLEAEAVARGLSKSNSSTVRSVQELEETIRPALTEGQNAADLAPKIWERMQSEDAGTAMPRREGFEAFYGDKSGMNPKTGAPSFLAGSLKKLLPKVGGGQVIAATIDVQGRPESGTGLQQRREYQGPTLGVFEIRAVADDPNLPSAIQSQLNEVADLVRRGQSIESAMQQAGSISAAQALGGDMVPLSEVPSQQLGFDITPAMREKVATSGLPMFSNRVAQEETKETDKPATKDESVVDGVQFSSRQRDLTDVPTMEFKDLVDKKVFGIKADLMDAGRSYTGIDGSQLEFPVEMMGGPNYPRLKESQAHKVVWAVKGGAVLTKILKQAEKADYIIVHAMNGNSHLTNSTASAAYIKTVEAYLRDGRISKENLLALDEIVRSPKNKSGLPDFPGFESPEIYDYIDKLSFEQRGALAEILKKKEAQVHGLPNLDRFRRETLDPEYVGYRKGDAMLVIELDKDRTPVRLGENGTKLHPAYPLALRGRVVGKFSKGINYETIYRDYFQNAVPNFKNGEDDAWYSFDRLMPIQKITPQIASSVAPGGFTAIKTARQAEAALALGNGNWLMSGKTKATGGVSVQEFVDALAANDGAAALTLYTAKEVNAGIKDKTFRVYQLGNQGGDKGLQIFFGLKRGRPWYADMIEGIGDNEVEVVSVTNNEPGAPGIGIPAIITKAISEGATVLDAFAVKSKRFPNGFLPEMYGQFGFEEIGRISFDPSYYDANQLKDLKAFWSKGGWKESDGYPDVVVMRWKGKDEDRATAVERYVRTGETSVPEGDAQFTGSPTEDAHGQRNQSGSQQGGTRGADRGEAGGNQGAGNAAPVVKRAYGSIQELATLSDGDIQNLGLNPKEVTRLRDLLAQPGAAQVSPTAVITPSNRLSPADRIKWREVADVKQEIALDKLPAHIVPFAQFMRTMADKASNGGLTSRDLIKAYTIARSSMNRGAVDTNKVKAAGLVLPASFTDAKIRPEGAFGYWLLSPMGQQYLNAAEVAIVDATSIKDAVKVMAPFGTQNTLGEDLERAATGTLHTRLPALSAAIKKAAKGGDAVKDWQDALDNLYGVREAKKGFLGSLLGFGQLPTFDARQINVNVDRESKEDTLRALSSTRAREVVAILAMRMDALSLTMDPKYAPFYRHLVHHAVWDAVGNTETTHSDVMESMLQASNRAAPDMAESRPVGPVSVIIDGRTMRVPDPAGAVEKLDAKINRYSELLKCLQ